MANIRTVTIEDATQIAAIYEPWVRDTAVSFESEPPGWEEMARRIATLSRTHPWVVIEEEAGSILGYAYASPYRQRPAYLWSVETTIYLHIEHRGRGLGKALYAALLDLATNWGYTNAFAGIALPNPESVSLHASVGFTPIGVFPKAGFKLGVWHDVGWWHRPLSPATPPHPPVRPPEEQVRALLTG